jgi:ribonuclease D
MPEFEFVDLRTDTRLCEVLDATDCIGIDTEFVREKTYFSRLCLIQISSGEDIFCADPLGLESTADSGSDGFWQALRQPAWVLHSGRQDLEVLYQTASCMPGRIFDTQIAAAFLGYQPQIGYANLVAELFNVDLAKTHTRADWSRRPLPQSFKEYAAEDVVYLLPAQEILRNRLSELGRLDWALEDSADLLQTGLYDSDPGKAIDRIRGAGKLRGTSRSAAADLATWREREALRSNRPRQWIMRDAVLLALAGSRATSKGELDQIDGLGERTIERAGDVLLKILQAATARRNDYEPPPRPDEKQKKILQEMQRLVSACADELGIASEIIAPRKELSSALSGAREGRVFKGWRRTLVGAALLELLEH